MFKFDGCSVWGLRELGSEGSQAFPASQKQGSCFFRTLTARSAETVEEDVADHALHSFTDVPMNLPGKRLTLWLIAALVGTQSYAGDWQARRSSEAAGSNGSDVVKSEEQFAPPSGSPSTTSGDRGVSVDVTTGPATCRPVRSLQNESADPARPETVRPETSSSAPTATSRTEPTMSRCGPVGCGPLLSRDSSAAARQYWQSIRSADFSVCAASPTLQQVKFSDAQSPFVTIRGTAGPAVCQPIAEQPFFSDADSLS
ncbi:MAG: hypothetical protein KDA89_14495, partial [Planctomycetaceae bacterium]|nr:hypothetical protein [Planctomycetaceae bacterium]